MAILNASDAAQTHRAPLKPACKPALFVRSLIPKGAIQKTISCSMLPPHALTRNFLLHPPSLQSARQLIVATDTTLQLYAVDDHTIALTALTDVMLFTRIYDIAAVSSPIPGRDVLVVLTDASKISFMQFDETSSRLRCSGEVTVVPPASYLSEAIIRRQARSLATHPRKHMVAVASLQSIISVFPVLFLPKHVKAGKIATVAVDGVILSLDFLEDEEGVPGDAILVALLQKGKEQVIALYTVGVPDIGGLSVTFVGSMITCVSHPDDVAVARATSKLTGESMRPTPPAVAVSRLAGCPFLFAVFVRGRIIAGDARSVIVNAHSGESLPMSVRIEHDIMLPSAATQELAHDDTPDDDDADMSHAPSISHGVPEPGVLTPSSSGVGFDSQEGFITPTRTPTNRALGDPPAVTMPSRRTRRGGRDDIPPMPGLGRRVSASRSPYTGQGDRNAGEEYLSYLFVPAYISLDIGEGNGVATAWVDARDHFSDDGGDGSGLYFVMESGAMFALRWSDNVREGATTFRIPGGERTRTAPKRNFSVEFVGDVGPAISIASLDRGLLFTANDCADGSLRRLHVPHSTYKDQSRTPAMTTANGRHMRFEGTRYGLEVRQEFLNLSPISDIALFPPQKLAADPVLRSTDNLERNTSGGDSHSMVDTDPETGILLTKPQSDDRKQSAFEHVIHGGARESEIVACSGIGQYGSIRLIRPGAPVSMLASSDHVFSGCNDMWPVRFTRDSTHDAGLVLTFAQATSLLLSVPPTMENEDVEMLDADPEFVIARLIDGTSALGLLSDRRTLAAAIVRDGVFAQVHEDGVRLMFLKKGKNVRLDENTADNVLREPLYERVQDWSLQEDGIISMGTVGSGYVLVSVISRQHSKPVLYLLECDSSSVSYGLKIVASVELEDEVSCMEIPEWSVSLNEVGSHAVRKCAVFILGTYAPSLEVRALDASLEVLDKRATYPWNLAMLDNRWNDRNRHISVVSGEMSDLQSGRTKGALRRPRHITTESPRTRSDHMTAVPESICGRWVDGRKKILVGLRDGSVMYMSFTDGDTEDSAYPRGRPAGSSGLLLFDGHRKLGHRPVVLKTMTAAIGPVTLAQAERPWMATSSGSGRIEWIPLAFTETNAICSFSVKGAQRCFAAVASDNSFYICALRRKSALSVRSIHVGATPRRVLALSNPEDCIAVATCNDLMSTRSSSLRNQQGTGDGSVHEGSVQGMPWHSEVRIYGRKQQKQLGSVSLLRGELVHILINWLGFVIVGTSWGTQEGNGHRRCSRGRLLMYTLRHGNHQKPSTSSACKRVKFSLCSELVLPGAVLAGAAHPSADIFVASCNEEVVVFAVPKSKTALVEIARISARTLVVGISLQDDIVCVVDRKDSVSFFQLHSQSGRLVRDRSDHRRRIVSDAVLVDRTLAVAVDRIGGLFSLGYEDGDTPTQLPIAWPDGSVMSPYFRNLPDASLPDYNLNAAGPTNSQTGAPSSALGEEFDLLHLDSGSDPSTDINDQEESITTIAAESNIAMSPEASEHDHVMAIDESAYAGNLTDGNDGSDDGNGSVGQGGETDEANPAQSADDGMMVAIQDDANLLGAGSMIGSESVEARLDDRRNEVPRNLVCHHSYNLNDTSLKVRIGEFIRYESLLPVGGGKQEAGCAGTLPNEKFFRSHNSAILCGTLGGAIVAAVPMSVAAYELLSEVEREMGDHVSVAGPALGSSHKRFRSAFGSESSCCVDGDLLKSFRTLDIAAKSEIATRAGCTGDLGVVRIEGMIDELVDRVG